MDNTLMTIIGIFLAALLMFVVPLMSISERNDDVAQTVVQTATAEFVDKISISGLIKPSDYEEYQQKLSSTGNTYEIEIEVQHLDENFGKKSGTTSGDLIGENERYSTFTTEILDNMYLSDGTSQNYLLNKGDNVIVTAKNTNKTMAQTLRTFIYKITGQGTYQIGANSSSMVVNNGGGKYIEVDTEIPEYNNDRTIVTFNANGGDTTPDPRAVIYGSTYGKLADVIRTGYTHIGWYTESTGGTKIEESTRVTTTISHELYAHWEANKYTVTFDANGGSCSENSRTVTYNSTYGELPKPERTGYVFKGWFTEKEEGKGIEIKSDSTVTTPDTHTLHAHWDANKYTVDVNILVGDRILCKTGLENIKFDITVNGEKEEDKIDYYIEEISYGSQLVMEDITIGGIYKYEGITIKQGNSSEDINSGEKITIKGETEIILKVKLNPDAEFIESNENYRYYRNKYGDYKVLSDCPKNGGLSSTGKNSMLLNVTFEINDYAYDENGQIIEQLIVASSENCSWGLRINPNQCIDIVIWNAEEGRYYVYGVGEKTQTNTIYNVTAMYDGTKLKMYLKDITNNTESYKEYDVGIKLYQRDDIPTLIGENPILRNSNEGSYYINQHSNEQSFLSAYNNYTEKNETSTFDGWIYNVRLWYGYNEKELWNHEKGLSDTEIEIIYNEAKNMLEAYEKNRPSNVLRHAYKFNDNGNYYKVFNGEFSWEVAKEKCEAMGGHLATITSQKELDFIQGIRTENSNNYWLGATDKDVEGQWKWVTGEQFTYSNWNTYTGGTEPNDGNDGPGGNKENYLHIYEDGKWNDGPDWVRYGYICEWEY